MDLAFKNVMIALKKATLPECKYSAFSTFLFEHFDLFVCEPITKKFATSAFSDVLFQAYEKFADASEEQIYRAGAPDRAHISA